MQYRSTYVHILVVFMKNCKIMKCFHYYEKTQIQVFGLRFFILLLFNEIEVIQINMEFKVSNNAFVLLHIYIKSVSESVKMS